MRSTRSCVVNFDNESMPLNGVLSKSTTKCVGQRAWLRPVVKNDNESDLGLRDAYYVAKNDNDWWWRVAIFGNDLERPALCCRNWQQALVRGR